MTIGGNARPAQPVTAAVLPRGPAGGGGERDAWADFIQSTQPWFWWRLNERGTPADLLIASDRMKRLDMAYRMSTVVGGVIHPPVESWPDETSFYDPILDVDPNHAPFLRTYEPGLVSNNTNRGARFRDSLAWVETPYTFNSDDFTAEGFYPWFLEFSALCLFRVDALTPGGSVADLMFMNGLTNAAIWRVGVYYDDDGHHLFFVGDGSHNSTAILVASGVKHMLEVSLETTLVGYGGTLRWRDRWTPYTIYEPNDIVATWTDTSRFSGADFFVCTETTISDDPTSSTPPTPWDAVVVDTSTFHIYLDGVEQFTEDGFYSFDPPQIFRAFTSLEFSNQIPMPGLDITGDEVVVWARPFTADERATALDLSGV